MHTFEPQNDFKLTPFLGKVFKALAFCNLKNSINEYLIKQETSWKQPISQFSFYFIYLIFIAQILFLKRSSLG